MRQDKWRKGGKRGAETGKIRTSIFPEASNQTLELYSTGGTTRLISMEVYELDPALVGASASFGAQDGGLQWPAARPRFHQSR